jgi:hypothetical protein
MFSPWIFKKRIFGIDINIEFDFYGPIFKTWQAVYEFRLKRQWNNRKNSTDFMRFALGYLPNGSYIIFYFDETGNEFIQFSKNGIKIILDIPIWETNLFFNKKNDLIEILKKSGIKKGAITNLRDGRNKTELRVDFGNHNAIASKVATEICKEIFGLSEPNLVKYETHALVQKRSN